MEKVFMVEDDPKNILDTYLKVYWKIHFNIFFFLLYLISKVNRHNKKEVIAMFQIVRMIIDIINFFAIFYMIFKEKS